MRKIYFDSASHKYINEMYEPYISTTTVIGKYEDKFSDKEIDIAKACERIGKNPNYKDKEKYLKYRGLTYKQILANWKKEAEKGCDIGNYNHDKLEIGIKNTTIINKAFSDKEYKEEDTNHYKRLYTIDEVLQNIDAGISDLDKLQISELKDDYTVIYDFLNQLVKAGYRLFPELVGYDDTHMICGCIDLPAIHPNGNFIIVDWKTNKVPIMKAAGYYYKDRFNNIDFNQFIPTPDKIFNKPLQHLPCSNYYKYAMQLSVYAKFLEQRGLNHMGNCIFHIRHEIDTSNDIERYNGKKKIDTHIMPYLSNEVDSMFNHYSNKQLVF